MKNNFAEENKFYNIYRGFVLDNEDPLNRGRIKIFVPGVYSSIFMDSPEKLPWALPAMSIFGGGSTNQHREGVLNPEVGWASVPHMGNIKTGSQVFIFFENGDINHPVYFAVSQSGEGWISEHPDQHVFNSDNVRIRIDESAFNEETGIWETDEKSTCRFDSYTENIPELGKKQLEKDCEKNKWNFKDGKIKELETRIDIEVKANNINAVNLNIHGNVNMHIDGNWFVEHIGNKYEYQKGDHYINHEGSTYIEHNGIYKNVQEGNRSYIQTGKYNYIQTGDALITRTGTLFEKINSNVKKEYDQKFDLTVGGKTNEIYGDDRTIDIMGNYTKTVKKNRTEDVIGNIEITTFGHYEIISNDDISFSTKKGNFTVKTEGLFELFDSNDNLTVDGYNNLGNKGNIQFVSTFGNINLQCIKNDNIANFSKKSVVIPWNPGFLAEIEKNIAMFPNFNKLQAVTEGLKIPSENSGIGGVISLIKSFSNLLIYDGLPVYLPTKMIFQNPNIPSPNNTDDLSWIPNFRSEASDWRLGDNNSYWKIPGRMMGNINIETWSGDINIKTESELGCAGNINIVANEKTGTFPGYQIGCVNIKNSARKRIYPDPRDLFFDSDFIMKQSGKLNLFSHGTNIEGAAMKGNILLPKGTSSLISSLGFSLKLHALDYNDFYKMNALAVASNGNIPENMDGILDNINRLKTLPAPKLGCLKCISDYFLGIPGVQDICYVEENLNNFSTVGIHKYGFSRLNPFDVENPRGVFNINSGDYDKVSMGDGHAIEIGFTDREMGGKNIGSFNLISDTDINITTGKNYYVSSNTSKPQSSRTFSHVVTDKAFDYNVPKVIIEGLKILPTLWTTFGETAFKISDGIIKIKNKVSIDSRIKLLNIIPDAEFINFGYINELTEKVGKNIMSFHTENNQETINFGLDFENLKEFMKNPDFTKLKVTFKKIFYISKIFEDGIKEEYITGTDSLFSVENFSADMKVLAKTNNCYHSYIWINSKGEKTQYRDKHSYNDIFDLSWTYKDSINKMFLPDWSFENNILKEYFHGNGINENKSFIDSSSYGYHDELDENVNLIEPIPGTSYIDINNSYSCITEDQTSVWLEFLKGPGRNISNSFIYNAGNDILTDVSCNAGNDINNTKNFKAIRSNTDLVTYVSPINTNVLTLDSDNVWINEENTSLHSSNLIQIITNGNDVNLEEYKDWEVYKSNNIQIKQNNFHSNNVILNNGDETANSNNKISIVNGCNELSKTNTIEVFNGVGSKNNPINDILINNGENTEHGTNLTMFNTGTLSKKSSSRFVVNTGNLSQESLENGESELGEIILNSCPDNSSASYKLHTLKVNSESKVFFESYITEYADIEKVLTTRFIKTISEENISITNKKVINAASIIKFTSPKIDEDFKILDKPIIKPPLTSFIGITIKHFHTSLIDHFSLLKDYIKKIFFKNK